MRRIPALAVALVMSQAALCAQSTFNVDLEIRMEIDNVSTVSGGVDHDASGFHASMGNVRIFGDLSEGLHYFYRQRLTERTFDGRSFFDSIDFAMLAYSAGNLEFTAGKGAVALGGYEVDSTPIDEYWFCDHSNAINAYLLSASAAYKFNDRQKLSFQISQSPYCGLGGRPNDLYGFSLMWNGRVLPKWETIWSVNVFQQDLDWNCIDYLSLGNRFLIGRRQTLDIDFMERGLVAMQARLCKTAPDFSVVLKYSFRVSDKLELQFKGTYDRNSGVGIDLVLPDGADNWTIGGGLCWFPTGSPDLRVFGMCCKAVDNGTASVAYTLSPLYLKLGTTWKVHLRH